MIGPLSLFRDKIGSNIEMANIRQGSIKEDIINL